MERKIGEIFEYNGEWYQCVRDTTDDNCNNCFFQKSCSNITGDCSSTARSDGKSVVFKKLEKVGEPYYSKYYGKFYQKYITYIPAVGYNFKLRIEPVEHVSGTEIYVELKQKEDMEEKGHYIGEIWGSNGWYYKCVPQEDEKMRCQGCVFAECGSEHCEEWHGGCSKEKRTDGKNVIFKRLKEVWKNTYWGEPKWCDKNVYETFEDAREAGRAQGDRYITSENIANEYGYVERDVKCNDKKDKDIEEKKLNLKPFDIQKAREGKPVCTRDGRKARIICFDAKGDFPIVALVETNNIEEVYQYTNNGLFFHLESNDLKRVDDLMMLPEKRSGWVNVYNNPTTHNIYTSADVFESKEIAEEQGTQRNRIATCKITWEE